MFDIYRKELNWGGKQLILETGKIARQADGAVLASLGETTVLCTAVGAKSAKPGIDFFPLTVNYQEKTFAAGKIPGGFFKREGRPTEKETLVSRLIDRPIRPLFAKGFRNETQVVCTVLSHDMENDPDIVAIVGASAALTISGLPFLGPIGGCRVGYINDEYVLNPTQEETKSSKLDLVMAGTREGVLMVESEASSLPEDLMLGAVMFGHEANQIVIDAIIELAEACAKEPRAILPEAEEVQIVKDKLNNSIREDLQEAYKVADKVARQELVATAKNKGLELLETENEINVANDVLKAMEADIVRGSILDTGIRIDGRDTKTVRPIESEVGILPRAHGSALFTRGDTSTRCDDFRNRAR